MLVSSITFTTEWEILMESLWLYVKSYKRLKHVCTVYFFPSSHSKLKMSLFSIILEKIYIIWTRGPCSKKQRRRKCSRYRMTRIEVHNDRKRFLFSMKDEKEVQSCLGSMPSPITYKKEHYKGNKKREKAVNKQRRGASSTKSCFGSS